MLFLMIKCVQAETEDASLIEFEHAQYMQCDEVYEKLQSTCENMICNDVLVHAYAECWKKSMNETLNHRLLILKKKNITQYHSEMNIQKIFNLSVEKLCGKSCEGDNETVGMRGIPYNHCRVAAYTYRTEQAKQINTHQLTSVINLNIRKINPNRPKTKDTHFFNDFIERMCHMPQSVWLNHTIAKDCTKKMFANLNQFEFTDDVCDLS